eukprot:5040540-Prymnesium_polylepis.3
MSGLLALRSLIARDSLTSGHSHWVVPPLHPTHVPAPRPRSPTHGSHWTVPTSLRIKTRFTLWEERISCRANKSRRSRFVRACCNVNERSVHSAAAWHL